jgi:hypothetical protein
MFPEQRLVAFHAMDELLERDIFRRLSISYATSRSGGHSIDALDSGFHTIRTSMLLITFDLALPAGDTGNLVWGSLGIACIGWLEGHYCNIGASAILGKHYYDKFVNESREFVDR